MLQAILIAVLIQYYCKNVMMFKLNVYWLMIVLQMKV